MEITPATVKIGETTYNLELGTIEEINIGREDHGIPGINITLVFPKYVQGTGWYDVGDDFEELGKWVSALTDVLGVRLEQMPGMKVWVLRQADMIDGFMGLDMTEYRLMKEFLNESND